MKFPQKLKTFCKLHALTCFSKYLPSRIVQDVSAEMAMAVCQSLNTPLQYSDMKSDHWTLWFGIGFTLLAGFKHWIGLPSDLAKNSWGRFPKWSPPKRKRCLKTPEISRTCELSLLQMPFWFCTVPALTSHGRVRPKLCSLPSSLKSTLFYMNYG